MSFPISRPRRLRKNETFRSMVRETRLSPAGFVYPLFVCPGEGVRKEVRSMPGVFNLSVDEAVKEAQEVKSLGIPSVILFGLPESKDEQATGAWADDGIVQQATRAIKKEVPGLLVMGDVCLCEYMSHGHCGIVQKTGTGRSVGAASVAQMSGVDEYEILNDESLEIIAKTAVSQARAGIDIIAPSDMMDGRVAAIRDALDDDGFENIPILSLRGEVCLRLSTARSAKPPIPRPHSAIAALTRWTAPTSAKPCSRSSSTSKKART